MLLLLVLRDGTSECITSNGVEIIILIPVEVLRMLTKEKIKIYKSFKGDVDFFGRSHNKKIKMIITEADFRLIDDLVQDLHLINNNLASSIFKEEFKRKIETNCCKDLDQHSLFEELNEIYKKGW